MRNFKKDSYQFQHCESGFCFLTGTAVNIDLEYNEYEKSDDSPRFQQLSRKHVPFVIKQALHKRQRGQKRLMLMFYKQIQDIWLNRETRPRLRQNLFVYIMEIGQLFWLILRIQCGIAIADKCFVGVKIPNEQHVQGHSSISPFLYFVPLNDVTNEGFVAMHSSYFNGLRIL
jgi:hypothetical protein